MIFLTVGVTSYNQFNYLNEALNSIFDQRFIYEKEINIKVLIGHDNPKKILKLTDLNVKNKEMISIFNHSKNLGEINNLNFLLNKCKTEWFTWLADDDLWHSNYLNSFIKRIKNHKDKEISGFFSYYDSGPVINKNFKLRRCENFSQFNYDQSEFIDWFIKNPKKLIGCYGIMSSTFLKKIGYPQLGSSFSPYSDDLIPILLSKYGKINWTNEKLIFLRTHKGSKSANSGEIEAYTSAQSDFMKKFLKIINLNIQIKKNLNYYSFLLIQRFMYDDSNVLFRNKNYKIIKKINLYSKIQIRKNQNLNSTYKIYHLFYIFYIPLKIISIKIIRKIIN